MRGPQIFAHESSRKNTNEFKRPRRVGVSPTNYSQQDEEREQDAHATGQLTKSTCSVFIRVYS